jgi:beta-lactamase regulating signal transducer with metallopeptidase domain
MNGFWLLTVATWRALPLLALALIADLVLRRRLASKYHALLWTLVVIRLMLPVSLPNAWSLQGPVDRLAACLLEASEPEAEWFPPSSLPDVPTMRIGESEREPLTHRDPTALDSYPAHTIQWQDIVVMLLFGTWILVAAGLVLRSLLSHLRFALHLRRCRELNDPRLVDLILRECDALGISRRPKLKEVPQLTAPAVFGLLRSTICLPLNAIESLSEQELRFVLRHELAHIRRRDAWIITLASIMQSLHWINPLAWLATSRLRWHVEAAADELALATCSSEAAFDYGRLLLRFAEEASPAQPSPALGFLMSTSGRKLRWRIEMLTRNRLPRRGWIKWSIALAMVALAAIGLTDASYGTPARKPAVEIHLPEVSVAHVKIAEADDGPVSLRTYDVTEALEKIRKSDPEANAELLLLATSQAMAPQRSIRIADGKLIAEVTEHQDQALTEMLDAWRGGGPLQIAVELRIIQADLEQVSAIDWVGARIKLAEQRGPQPMIAARVTDDQMRRFVNSAEGDARTNILQAPKMTLFNGQSATYDALSKRPFVTGIEPVEKGAYQPVVEILEEGFKIKVRPIAAGDGSVDLTFDLQSSQIGDVGLANLPFRSPGESASTTIQVPHVSTASAQATVRLAVAETVMIAAPQVFDASNSEASTSAVFYAFTPRVIE